MLTVAQCSLRTYFEGCPASKFEAKQTKQITPWLFDALAYAHTEKDCHRDIKPLDILIKIGQPCLTDFGLAKVVTALDDSSSYSYPPRGTPAYCLPGSKHNASTDIFSLVCSYLI